MRVVRVVRFGGPEVLVPGEAPDPVAGPGEVVVATEVASVTFVETQIRRGADWWPRLPELPYVPGGLVAGRVAAAGAGVDPAWLGRPVVARTGATGGFAERAVAPAAALLAVPDGVDLRTAAALAGDGSTAEGLVQTAGIAPGEWVLVEAAAGGVGSLLVQLARLAGARVLGAAGAARKLAVAGELGAEAVVDYTEPGWTDRVLAITGGAGPDLVFDGVGGAIGRAAFGVTARGGRFSAHGAAGGPMTGIDPADAARRGVTVLGGDQLAGFRPRLAEWGARMLARAAAGEIRALIGQTFPLDRAADAHAAMETRATTGKTLLLTTPG